MQEEIVEVDRSSSMMITKRIVQAVLCKDIIEGNEAEDKHSNVVLEDFEAELRMLEEWLKEPKTNEEVVKEDEGKCKFTAQVIAPIIAEGDPIGAVILSSKEPNVVMGDLEVKIAETAAGFLAKQMEQ